MRRALVVVLVAAGVASAAEPVTLSELETLLGQGAFDEVLERAEALPAAARAESWRALVTTAAVGRVTAQSTSAVNPFAGGLEAERLGLRYRFLQDRPAFRSARDAAVLAGAARCAKASAENDACRQTLQSLQTSLTPAGSLTLLKRLRAEGWTAEALMPVVDRAVPSIDVPACADPVVQDLTVAALDVPFELPAAALARVVAFERCWSPCKAKLQAAMVHATTDRLKNSCEAMKKRKGLTPLQLELCADDAP
jgi:hypothetical protein